MLKIFLVVTCNSILVEENAVGSATMLGFEKYRDTKTKEASWLFAAKL